MLRMTETRTFTRRRFGRRAGGKTRDVALQLVRVGHVFIVREGRTVIKGAGNSSPAALEVKCVDGLDVGEVDAGIGLRLMPAGPLVIVHGVWWLEAVGGLAG